MCDLFFIRCVGFGVWIKTIRLDALLGERQAK